jgi:crotonobetainyl-CoA:carnitine CoA-transferase CaiB-like acyl-CoA transferase
VYPDYLTGLFTAFGVLTALRHRDATGEGQWIDASLYESAFRILEYTVPLYGRQGVVRERGGLQHVAWPGGACQTGDGRWIVFTAPAQHLFERLCTMMGQPDLPHQERFATAAGRTAHMPELMQMAEAWFAAHDFEDVAREFEVHQVPYAPLMSMADIFAEPHYREREMIIEVPDTTLGSIPHPGVVPKLSRTPGRVTHAGPSMGTHTDEILTALLGMSPDTIAELRHQGVI